MEELRLVSNRPRVLKSISLPRRHELIEEAISLSRGKSTEAKEYHTLYTYNDYQVKVGKPGKEFDSSSIRYQDGIKGNNPNDMTPTIFKNGQIMERVGSFEEVFKTFIKIVPAYDALQLLGCLCVRNSMCLDHQMDSQNKWRYVPPKNVVERIQEDLPDDFGEPLMIFLYYMELIALNEDTKYHTLGYDIKTGIGRYNNLLTYANIINIILHRRNLREGDFLLALMEFAGGLVRPPVGLNPISLKKALIAFPQLISND